MEAVRLMYHPEQSDNFADRGNFQVVDIPDFEHHPLPDSKLDRHLGAQQGQSPNCVEMLQQGMISGFADSLLQELSVHRRYITSQGNSTDTTAGKYHLSIILMTPDEIFPHDDQAVLRVRLHARDVQDTTQLAAHVFDVPGTACYSQSSLVLDAERNMLASSQPS
jgi:hypothetical protein